MKARTRLTRRRFIALSSLTGLGVWATSSTQVGARTIKEVVQDARRTIALPHFIPAPGEWDNDSITAGWLGHATVLINFYGLTIVTDPALFKRIGANTAMGTIGPKRLVAAPLTPRQLPAIDLVLISHAHMDHLDPATLLALPGKPQVVTAKSTADLLPPGKFRNPQTLSWGESTRIKTAHGDVDIRAFQVNHWGARWRYDTYRGYNGYVISREGKSILFGGDTAWTESFKSVKKYGSYELAIMPIGAYQPWIGAHCNPEQAVRMADQAGAEHFLPIHFKTFPFGREGNIEPLTRLQAAIEPERIGWTEVGQTFGV